jgi:hypothetical protein
MRRRNSGGDGGRFFGVVNFLSTPTMGCPGNRIDEDKGRTILPRAAVRSAVDREVIRKEPQEIEGRRPAG